MLLAIFQTEAELTSKADFLQIDRLRVWPLFLVLRCSWEAFGMGLQRVEKGTATFWGMQNEHFEDGIGCSSQRVNL